MAGISMTTCRREPNFFIVGAHKAGTTALYEYLRQHPQVYLPEHAKEPCFFRGSLGSRLPDQPLCLEGSLEGETYLSLFEGAREQRAIGEASTDYLYYSAKSAKNIKRCLPNARIIMILRNPVERAYSNYLWALKECIECAGTFRKALDLEELRITEGWGSAWHYAAKGFYARQLTDYLAVFEKDRLVVHLYEDFKREPQRVCRDLFAFLGVDGTFEPNTSRKYNVSGVPKNRALQRLLRNPGSNCVARLGYLLPKSLRSRIRSVLLRLNTDTRVSAMPEFEPEVRSYLIDLYRSDIVALQDLIHRDLTSWLS